MLNLTTNSHSKLYKLPWILKDENMVVKQQVKVKHSIGYYEEKVLYDIMSMESCDILLEWHWQFDRETIHEGRTNKITFTHKKFKTCVELQTEIEKFLEIWQPHRTKKQINKNKIDSRVNFYHLFHKKHINFRTNLFLNYVLKNLVLLDFYIYVPFDLFDIYFR